ncbi:MAG: hypothetical protein WCY01_00115 [Alkalispirochaeta sp.]|jgi:hypothetical protein
MSDKPKKPVTDLVARSKLIFLQEIVEEYRESHPQYDLHAEFAKTKKNRSLMIPGVILALIVVFSIVIVAVTRYIGVASTSIQVNIDDFADVNLRDVLDEAQRLQNQQEAAQRQLKQFRAELADGIARVERERDRSIQLVNNQGLSVARRNARRAELTAQAESEIASLQGEYNPRIAELEERIQLLQEQMDQYDSRQLEQAREQEEILNNQQKVFELEKQEIREDYEAEIARLTKSYDSELAQMEAFQQDFEQAVRQRHAEELAAMYNRYNPVFEPETETLLNRPLSEGSRTFGPLAAYSTTLGDNGIASRREYAELRQQYAELQQIVARLQEVPYENSVGQALVQLEGRIYDLLRRYERLWTGLDGLVAAQDAVMERQERKLDGYFYSVDELTKFNGETGYILDPRDPDRIIVHIGSVRSVREGALGYVFRRDDEFIGSVRFVRQDGEMVARQVETVEDQEIRAFDKILIEAQ